MKDEEKIEEGYTTSYTKSQQRHLIDKNYHLLKKKYIDLYKMCLLLKRAVKEKNTEEISMLIQKRQENMEQIERVEKNLVEYLDNFGYSLKDLGLNKNEILDIIKKIIKLDKINYKNLREFKEELLLELNQQKNKLKVKREYNKGIKNRRKLLDIEF